MATIVLFNSIVDGCILHVIRVIYNDYYVSIFWAGQKQLGEEFGICIPITFPENIGEPNVKIGDTEFIFLVTDAFAINYKPQSFVDQPFEPSCIYQQAEPGNSHSQFGQHCEFLKLDETTSTQKSPSDNRKLNGINNDFLNPK